MRVKKKKFKKQFKAAISKYRVLEDYEKRGVVRMMEENQSVIVHYLIWHIWSNKGLVKFCQSLFFYMNMKLARREKPRIEKGFLTIWVDYGNEPNDYDRIGMIEMVRFNPTDGFKEASEDI